MKFVPKLSYLLVSLLVTVLAASMTWREVLYVVPTTQRLVTPQATVTISITWVCQLVLIDFNRPETSMLHQFYKDRYMYTLPC